MSTSDAISGWDKRRRAVLLLSFTAVLVVACTTTTAPAPRDPDDPEPRSAPTVSSTPATPLPTTPPPNTEDAARARVDAIRAAECFEEPLFALGDLDSEPSKRVDREATPDEQAELTHLSALLADAQTPAKVRREAFRQTIHLYFTMQNWPRAARISFEYALRTTDDIEQAFSYYADAMHAMFRLDRVRCGEHLFEQVGELHALHCAPPSRNAKTCKQLDRVFVAVRERRIVDKVELADKTNDFDLYRAAAEDYMAFLDAHCRPKSEPRYDRCDEVAYNAGTLFVITQQRDRAKAMLEYLKDPKNRLRGTELGKRFQCRYDDRPMSECEGQ
jgi:hypothetical protein